jgi:hypothetical protein
MVAEVRLQIRRRQIGTSVAGRILITANISRTRIRSRVTVWRSFPARPAVAAAENKNVINMKKITLTFSLTLFAFVSLIHAQNAQVARPKGLIVHINIYSGVPDPVFVITDEAAISKIFNSIKVLPQHPTLSAQTDSATPGILGYKGYHIENNSDKEPDIAGITVYKGDIEIRRIVPSSSGDGKMAIVREFRADLDGSPTEALILSLAQGSGVLDAHTLQVVAAR